MKDYKKLELLNQKIVKLSSKQKEIEAKMLNSVSRQVASLLIRKNAASLDIPTFLKKVEDLINEMNAQKKHL